MCTPLRPRIVTGLLLVGLAGVTACGDSRGDDTPGHDSAADAHAHVHAAPRGGALVVLAEEGAHVEILLDPGTGRLSLLLLGAHAERPVRSTQPSIAVTLTIDGSDHEVELAAQASELTGETAGDTSEFAAQVPALVGAEQFAGIIHSVDARGATYLGVSFTYPPR